MQSSFSNRSKELRPNIVLPADLNPASFATAKSAHREDDRGTLIGDYWRTLSRYRWIIAAFAFGGVLASVLLTLGSLPYYRARTSLDIQSLNGDFMNLRSVAPTGDGSSSSSEVNVQTQIKLLQSETLLERTVDRLQSDPHPKFMEQTNLLTRIGSALHLPHGKPLRYADVLADTSKHVTVKPLGLTRLIEITCDSWDAGLAAHFCNELTSSFKSADLETRSNESEKTSQWLTQQVADIKLKAEESERKLVAVTGGNGLILSQDSTTVGEDRLRQIQSELVKAQADRIGKESELRIASTAAPGTNPSVLDTQEYRSYEQKLADLRSKVAELVPPLTEENPKIIHLRSQIKDVEEGMAATRSTNSGRMHNEYDAALHRETLLLTAYQAQEANVSSDLGKAAQVSLLRREVESEQQLYQTLLQRAKEAGFASAMQATTIRIVDAARTPKMPFSPKPGSAAAGGLLLGSLFGIGFAFLKDRNTQVFRMPGETERYLRVNELGVIPATESSRSVSSSLSRMPLSGLTGAAAPASSSALTQARWGDAFSVVAEAYRSTTFSILLSDDAARHSRVYVVSSPNAGEGKTTVTSNLGVALSKSKLRVVIIDGDLRKPGMHSALQVSNDFGVRNLLRGEINLQRVASSAYCKATEVPNLFVIPAGRGAEEVVELLHSHHLSELIDRLHQDFDVVLIDTPPMLHMADARIFARYAQGAILIFRAAVTSREQAAKARDLLERDRVHLVGTILNAFDPASEGRSHYYESYYRYKDQIESAEKAVVSS